MSCPYRRGVLVTPAEAGGIVQLNAADLTSRSLRKTDLTGRALQRAESEWRTKPKAMGLTAALVRRQKLWHVRRFLPAGALDCRFGLRPIGR